MLLTFFKNKTLRILIILQCAALPLQAQFTETIENFQEYNRKTLDELVFLHTDREVYYPGDTLWFKAYVRNKASLKRSSLSRDLFVYLFNENGSLIQDAKFLVSDSGVKGQLVLGQDLLKGDYYIAAYSSWMQNFGIKEVFKKRIRVRYLKKESYELIPSYDNDAYFPGDTVYMEINCHDELRREEEKVGFAWKVKSGNTAIVRGIANGTNSYDNHVRFVVPRDIQEPIKLEVSGDHKEVELDQTWQLPVHFNVQVDFFPEGGRALNGAMNNIAFKAVYPNGLPARIEGEIIDGQGNVMNTVASQHQGMGTFPLIPKKGTDYYLKITKPAGIAQQYKLPAGKDRGWHLSARNNQDKIYVEIQKQGLPTDTCMVTLMIRGHMFYSRVVAVDNTKSLTIPTGNMPSGIGVVTLLDQDLLPRAERLVFVNYHDRQQVEMTTGSKKYAPREKVTLNIQLTGPANQPVQGDYSLAVVDQKLGLSEKIENTSLFSAGFFSPEIKGRVFNPDHYFKTGSRQEQYHLDLLLLTQGWRNYRYLDQIQNIDSLPTPVTQDEISGQILGKPLIGKSKPTKGKVTVYFGGVSHTLETDAQGRFSFRPVFEGVNPNILLSATDEEGKEKVIIRMDSNRYENRLLNNMSSLIDSMDQQHVSPVQTHESIEKLYEWLGLNQYLLDPITVTARGPKKERDIEKRVIDNMPDRYKKSAPQAYIENNEDVYDILYDMKKEMDLTIRYNIEKDTMEYLDPNAFGNNPWKPIKWYVNGLPWRDDPKFIYTGAIKDLKLLFGETAGFLFKDDIERNKSYYLVVAYITTDSTKYQTWKRAYQMAHRKALPKYTFTKEFYKPVYDTGEKKEDGRFDFRKTIHWEPEVQVDSTGRATVTFYNADQYTDIKCILQGLSDEGVPAYGETGYEVKFVE